jgi:glycosyltransferase
MKFSILTCSYNNLEGVKAAVSEVRGQSFDSQARSGSPFEIEHIVIDGGSTDGTREWLEAEHRKFNIERPTSNVRLKWISEPDQGLYDALNKGLRLATGDVIGILHTDDVWEPGVLKRVWDAFEKRSEFGVQSSGNGASDLRPLPSDLHAEGVYGDLLYVDAEDISKVKRVWKSGSYAKRKWWNGWMPPHPALFVTRELAERVGEYRLDLGSAADYEWMLRAALVHDARLVYVGDVEKEKGGSPQKGSARVFLTFFHSLSCSRKNVKNHGLTPFARMRVGGQSNVSTKARLNANAADRRAWELNGLKPRPWTLWMKPLRKLPQWIVALVIPQSLREKSK